MMTTQRFEWDPVKAESNQRKHGISFETAIRAFADPFVLIMPDRIEDGEQRWHAIGIVDGHSMLLVVHTAWDDDDEADDVSEVIRVISARKADRKERQRYEDEER